MSQGLEVRDNIISMDRNSESQLVPMALPGNESRGSSSSMSVHEHDEYDPLSERSMCSMSPQSRTALGNISSSTSSVGRGTPHVGYYPVPERSISPTEMSREEKRRKRKKAKRKKERFEKMSGEKVQKEKKSMFCCSSLFGDGKKKEDQKLKKKKSKSKSRADSSESSGDKSGKSRSHK